MNKPCVLYDRPCQDCGECLRCDLDPNKLCDNCNRCIEEKGNFRSLDILKFVRNNAEDHLEGESAESEYDEADIDEYEDADEYHDEDECHDEGCCGHHHGYIDEDGCIDEDGYIDEYSDEDEYIDDDEYVDEDNYTEPEDDME